MRSCGAPGRDGSREGREDADILPRVCLDVVGEQCHSLVPPWTRGLDRGALAVLRSASAGSPPPVCRVSRPLEVRPGGRTGMLAERFAERARVFAIALWLLTDG